MKKKPELHSVFYIRNSNKKLLGSNSAKIKKLLRNKVRLRLVIFKKHEPQSALPFELRNQQQGWLNCLLKDFIIPIEDKELFLICSFFIEYS